MNVHGKSYHEILVDQRLYLYNFHRVHPNLFSREEIERGVVPCSLDILPLCSDDAYSALELGRDGTGSGL